jgi:putative glutamine amidotransferase
MIYPVIGVTTMRSKNLYGTQISSLAVAYVEALSQAGICPVLIPNQMPLDAVDDMLEGLDGVLFTGGGDVDTDFYQAEDHPMIKGVEIDRDQLELRLLERVIQETFPGHLPRAAADQCRAGRDAVRGYRGAGAAG